MLHVAHLFFNLLLNRSMLDFVLDSVKRSRAAGAIVTIENEREYARTRRHVSDVGNRPRSEYINILTWFRGFRVKLLYLVLFSLYSSLLWELRDKRNFKNLQF